MKVSRLLREKMWAGALSILIGAILLGVSVSVGMQELVDATPVRASGVTDLSQPGLGQVQLTYAGPNWYVAPDTITPAGNNTTGDGSESAPFRTIGKAVTQASNGHTIKVMDDDNHATYDYVENITVDKSLTIVRYDDSGANPQVKADNANSPVFNVIVSNVTIMGLDIYGATGSSTSGISLSSTDHCTISGNTCSNNYIGIYLDSASDNNIFGNTASSNTGVGIALESSWNNTISGNTANSNSTAGISTTYGDTNTVSGNIVNSNQYGIHLSSTIYSTISGNTVNSNQYGIHLFSSNNNTIYLNSFINNTFVNVNSLAQTHSANVWQSPTTLAYKFNGQTFENYMGNFYSDSIKIDPNGDGISGTVHGFPGSEEPNDSYPLMVPFHTLTMAVNPIGSGTTTPAVGTHICSHGSVVSISAAPLSGYRFMNWAGLVASANSASTTVTIDADKTVTANFALIADVNGDGVMNTLDISKLERIIAGLDASTPSADANQDGKVNALDITKVERLIGGLD